LISYGADPYSKNNEGESVYSQARQRNDSNQLIALGIN